MSLDEEFEKAKLLINKSVTFRVGDNILNGTVSNIRKGKDMIYANFLEIPFSVNYVICKLAPLQIKENK